MKQTSLYFLVAVFLLSCGPNIKITKLTSQTDLKESFFYALPRNTLEFEIKVRSTTVERSNQVNWSDACINSLANKYKLDPEDIKKIKSQATPITFAIEKDGITIAEGSKPDVQKIFKLNVKPKFFLDNVIGLSFNQDYVLTEGSVTSENKSFEIGLATISSTLSAITGLRAARPVPLVPHCAEFTPEEKTAFQELDNAINDYSTYIQLPNLPNTAEAYQTAKSHYEKIVQEKFEKALYKKSEKVSAIKFAVDLDDNMANGPLQIFRLNASGILEINIALSTRVKTSSNDKVSFVPVVGGGWYKLNTQRQTDDVFTVVNTHNPSPNFETGFVYNIPGTATFTLSKPTAETVLSNTYKVAQFGTIGSLNPKFSKAAITLDPITGSLTKASAESKSIATSNISGTADLFGKAKETFRKTTEEEELEKRAKLLELRAKIKELEEKQ